MIEYRYLHENINKIMMMNNLYYNLKKDGKYFDEIYLVGNYWLTKTIPVLTA